MGRLLGFLNRHITVAATFHAGVLISRVCFPLIICPKHSTLCLLPDYIDMIDQCMHHVCIHACMQAAYQCVIYVCVCVGGGGGGGGGGGSYMHGNPAT